MTPSPLTAVAEIPVPTGWTYSRPSPEDMPGIERAVGDFNLVIGLDDGKWRWWLCPLGNQSSIKRGEAAYLVDAIWRVFDALARHLDADAQETP